MGRLGKLGRTRQVRVVGIGVSTRGELATGMRVDP